MECIPLTIGDAGAAAHVPSDTKGRVTSSAKGAEWLAHSIWRAAFGTRAVGRERLARGGPYAAVVAPMFVVT